MVNIDRSFLDWQWYKDIHTSRLFIHCLLKADPESRSFTTSLSNLANELGCSVRNIRTAINHLISAGEIARQWADVVRLRLLTMLSIKRVVLQEIKSQQMKRQTSLKRRNLKKNIAKPLRKFGRYMTVRKTRKRHTRHIRHE